MEEGKREAVFRATPELLHDLLRLPADAKVTGFRHRLDLAGDVYEVRIVSDEFPLTPAMHVLPECNPTYERTGGGETKFLGWGLPKPEGQ